MQLLLESNININIRGEDGQTALYNISIEVTELLIKNSTDINIKDNSGYILLHIAAKDGDKELIQLLLKNKANFKKID